METTLEQKEHISAFLSLSRSAAKDPTRVGRFSDVGTTETEDSDFESHL
jgi:hypothetical protein